MNASSTSSAVERLLAGTRPWAALAFCCALLLGAPANAIDSNRALTQALLRKWQIQQGLPQPTITAITQASDGTLWLGTQEGLYQFDGVRFDPALVVEGAPLDELWVTDLCEDRDGNLWISSRGDGLVSLKNGRAVRYAAGVGFPLRVIHCLMLDADGSLWVGGKAGLSHYTGGTFRHYDHTDGLNIGNVFDLAQTTDGAVWIGGDGGGLAEWKDGRFVTHVGPSDRIYRALLGDKTGGLWAGTNDGLLRIRNGQETRLTTADGLADNFIECLSSNKDECLWVGTRNGLCRLNNEEIECYRTRDGLTQSTVLTICEDHEGSLWVGTKHGLNQLADRRTLPVTTSEGLPTNDAGPVVQDRDGNIWIGTLGGGLALYDGRRCDVAAAAPADLPSNRLLSLIPGGEDILWIGTDNGLCRMKAGKVDQRFDTADGLPSKVITCLARDPDGRLWIGTSRGLVVLEKDKLQPATADSPVNSTEVFAIDSAGRRGVVVATAEGVFRILDGVASNLPGDPAWLKSVHALIAGRRGDYWLASRGRGLMRVTSRDEVFQYTVEDGLFDDEIVGIVEDERGVLWMGCSRGIFTVGRMDLAQFSAGRRTQLRCWSFSPTDALRTVECQRDVQPAIARTRNGELWFSTIHGMIVITPRNLIRELPKPLVNVTQLQVNGRPVATDKPLTLPPGAMNLSMRYTAHSYASPTRTVFRYRLEGFDEGWVYAGGRREAFYTNLSPGEYTFYVSAANPGERWTDAPQVIVLTLTPYFWQTRWFPALIGVAVLGFVWLFFRLRVLRVRTRLDAIVSERSRIARELHDTLIQGFSGVTMQMQAVSHRLADPGIRDSLNEVIADAGACLREARQSVAGLRNSTGTSMGLSAAIEQTARQLTEIHEVRLHLDLPKSTPPLPVEVEFNLLRIAQEAIANAARHSQAHTIDVSLEQQPGRLELRVRDDGVGFSLAEKEKLNHRHYGLIGMRERSRQISADLKIESRPGSGTTILVDLPISGMAAQDTATSTSL